MPYIKQEDRERLLRDNNPKTEGELNYLLTLAYMKFIKEYGESYTNYGYVRTEIQIIISYMMNKYLNKTFIHQNYFVLENMGNGLVSDIRNIIYNFDRINSDNLKKESIFRMIIGALINSSEELYRRKIAPYEDKKIIENGDVY